MKSIVKRIVKQMLHDKRSLGLMFIVPLLLLTLLYLLLGKSSYIPVVAIDNLPDKIVSVISENKDITVITKSDYESNEEYIKAGNADAVISMDADGIHIKMLEMDNVKINTITDSLKTSMAKINPASQMDVSFIYGASDESTFDSLGYMLLGFLSFFIIFIVSGISFVRERTSGTLERLMRTPVKTTSIVLGYILGFGIFAIIQSTLMILFARFILKMQFIGQWWIATLFMLLIAMISVMLGILVSVLSKNEFQVVQFIPIIVVPQFFFSGLISVNTLPYNLSYLSHIMPLYYGCTGLKEVMVYGYGFLEVLPYILPLLGFLAVLFIANILAVKKYRTA